MPDFNLSLVLIGAAGGLLPDAIRFAKQRHEGFPDWFKKVGYWVGLLVLVVLGGLAAWLGGGDEWQTALALGFSAPEVLSRLAGTDQVQTKGVGDFQLRQWWAK